MDADFSSGGRGIAQGISDRLAHEIRMGILKPGAKLPSERELGERFGAGRSSVREALGMLRSQGMVRVEMGRGSFVSDFTAPSGESMQLFWGRRHEVGLDKLIEVRLAIEPQIAALAARRAGEDHFRQLEATLENLKRGLGEGGLGDRVFADIAFHDCLVRASDNPLHLSIYRGLEPMLFDVRRMGLRSPERAEKVLRMHEEIHDAVRARDPGAAAAAMREHLLSFAADMGVVLETATLRASEER